MAGPLRPLLDGLLAVILASPCVVCANPLEEPVQSAVCSRCWASIRPLVPPLCAACGESLASWRDMPRQLCSVCCRGRRTIAIERAIGEYDGALRAILHALKYDRRQSLAYPIGELMRAHGQAVLGDADAVVPVPLHWRRRWQRGFNQSAALARDLGPPLLEVLRRRRSTHSQTDLPADQRRANVRNAFAMRRGADVAGLRVVLVDDIKTTGATLEACAGVLLSAGAREVRTLTAARVQVSPQRGRPR